MSTLAQTRVLATPQVFVGGQLVKVIADSVTEVAPGSTAVRAVSAGGGVVAHVSGLNVEDMKGVVSFEMATTAENVQFVQKWRDDSNRGLPTTVQIIEETHQSDYELMWLTEAPEIAFAAEGNISVTFEGSQPTRS